MRKPFIGQALILLLLLGLSSGCTRQLVGEGSDDRYNALSLALSFKNTGEAPAVQTRMTALITQDGYAFRGIDEVYMVPFQVEASAPITKSSPRLGNRNVTMQNPGIGQNGLVANNNAHLYNAASVPLNTNRVLAYGKASDQGSALTVEGKHRNGVLVPSGLENPAVSGDISFSLEPVLGEDEQAAVSATTENLIAALNAVVETLWSSGDADILAFLDVFAAENEIIACSYQTLYRIQQNIMAALFQYSGTNPEAINAIMASLSALESASNAAGSDFPASYGIPEGAIGMWWNGRHFVKLINGVNISLVPTPLFCYPPSLWYHANSTLRTSADEEVRNEYTPQNATWDNILSRYTDGATVVSSTRSVAMVDQMQYGVGLVEFRFVAPEAAAAAAAGCPMTGIIIGEQRDVDFSFSPVPNTPSRFVYDNNVSDITLGSTSRYVQVLVLPTFEDEPVHFALEFLNNTEASFPCQQGTVQPGSKFYLAGELKPGEGTKPSGAPITSIFSSDYKTTVYAKVSNLNNAYNTVPDLRDPQLEIGVAAEMDWIQVEPGGTMLPF